MGAVRESWDALVAVLAPVACVGCALPGRALCPTCAAPLHGPARPAAPDPVPPGMPPTYAVCGYDDVVRASVIAYKERGATSLAGPLGRALAASTALAVLASGWAGPVDLVPVPSSPQARREREHDAVGELARVVRRELRQVGLAVGVRPLLRPGRRRADQAGLGAAARAANLAGSMRAVGGPRPVVVLDDVVTTGATLVEAARALGDAGVTVLGAATVAATARRRRIG